ncbi:Protein of unknown function [Bacillus mobilis]|nr:Protein of unknown function [Bacillus mobilis]
MSEYISSISLSVSVAI